VELIVQPDAKDGVGEMAVRGDQAPRSSAVALALLLKNALERVFVLGSKREDIRHFLLGFFARVGAADSFPLIVDAKHVRNGFGMRHPEEAFQHHYDKVHRGIVVVQKQYAAWEVRHLCDLTPPKFVC
jgi:hypothetical protein